MGYEVRFEQRSDVVSSIGDKENQLHQIRHIVGQFGAIEVAIEGQSGGCKLLEAIAAARGSLDRLLLKVIEEHVRVNVIQPARVDDPKRVKPAEELVELVQEYLR
jgi:DNA-binding FrmR family transcriptional regulator